ncbi:distal tail protein Dit [Neobacillus sp. NPDC093127]|uniref:distal tail protein Dit n=1 Tax=Neobacillus sp. NPDC093127 TaxID=3364296 RepID=UPI0037F12CB0
MFVSVENMIFNGVDLAEYFNENGKSYFVVNDVRGRGIMSSELDLIKTPGMPGGHLSDETIPERILEVDISLKGNSYPDLRKKVDALSAILKKKDVAPIVFADETDKTYYGKLGNVSDRLEKSCIYQTTLFFVCPDPCKYGAEKYIEFTDITNLDVEGSEETYPNIKVEVAKDTTFLAVSDGESINMIGNPAQVTQQPFIREERKFWHEMGTLVGWADTTSVEEGKNLGTMKTSGRSFFTDAYGSDPGWHGPAKKTSIGSTIQDFQVDALIRQQGSTGQVGSIEIALLDASNKFVCKMLMTKRSAGSVANWARLRAGTVLSGYDIINTRGSYDSTWANFNGMVRLSRIGNVWTAYVCLIDSKGVQHTRAGATWRDSVGIATAPIAQVQVQLWQYGTTPATNQNIDDIKVYKINNAADNQIPYVARAGDLIEFDHVKAKILRNGEVINKEKVFIGDYFALQPGGNVLAVEPADAIEKTGVRWREKWL